MARPAAALGRPSLRSAALGLALLALFVLFARVLVTLSFSESLLFDDAMNADCAASFAAGTGYATHYPDPAPFDVRITTGPAVMLPAALLIGLTHGAYYAPMLAAVIINLSLLALFCVLALRCENLERSLLLACLCVASLMLRSYPGGSFAFSLWSTLLGEVPGCLLLACGALLVLHDEWKRGLWWGALLLGAAPLAKLVCTVPAALIMAVALAPLWRSQRRRALAALALSLAPAAAWELFKLASLGGAGYAANSRAREKFITWNLRGPALTGHALPLARERFSMLTHMLGGPGWGGACVLIAGLVLVLLAVDRRAGAPGAPWRRFSLALFGATLVMLFLWLGVATSSWLRYTATVELCLVFAVSAGIVALPPVPLRAVLGVAWLVCCGAQLSEELPILQAPPPAPTPRLQALLATRDYLRSLERRDDVILGGAGAWGNWDLQYTLGERSPFADLARLPPAPGRRRILVRSEFWNTDHLAHIQALAEKCDARVLWDRPPFRVSQCDP